MIMLALAPPSISTDKKGMIKTILGETWQILRRVDAHFGFRACKSAVRFIVEAEASSGGALTVERAIDIQLCQKFLVKLRGEGDRWRTPLAELESLFAKLGPKSQALAIVKRMRSDLERLGSFQFWG
jgi:hypothetical protein